MLFWYLSTFYLDQSRLLLPSSATFPPGFLDVLNSNSHPLLKMATALKNEAAWITAAKARPLQVGPGPNPDPADYEVVIKVAYAAVNPTDWKVSNGLSGYSVSGSDSHLCRIKMLHTLNSNIHGFLAQMSQEPWSSWAPVSIDSKSGKE